MELLLDNDTALVALMLNMLSVLMVTEENIAVPRGHMLTCSGRKGPNI